jgi:alginate O-acetyltransferase complex protein AlgI
MDAVSFLGHAPIWSFPIALLLLAKPWHRSAAHYEPPVDIDQPERVLGRRWNTAFRDLAHRFLFRPFTAWFGPRFGLFAGFLFSGAIHDLVISVPAKGGYGGPTAFFAIQGAAIIFEHSAFGHRMGLGRGGSGRAFTFLVLVAPVFLLFHRPFVVRVIVPFMRAIGAL